MNRLLLFLLLFAPTLAQAQYTTIFNPFTGKLDYVTPPATAVPNYGQGFTNQTTVTITNATHGCGSSNILVGVQDTSSPAKTIEPQSVTVDTSTYDVVVTFASSQSGTIILGCAASTGTVNKVSVALSAVTTITVTGGSKPLTSDDVQVSCWDNSSPRKRVEPNDVTVDSATFDVVITFLAAQTGRCNIVG